MLLQLHPTVRLEKDTLALLDGGAIYSNLSLTLTSCVQRLFRGAAEEELEQLVQEGEQDFLSYYSLMECLKGCNLLSYRLEHAASRLATLLPYTGQFRCNPCALDPSKSYFASRFSYCRNQAGVLILETPLFPAQLQLLDPLAALLWQALQQQVTFKDLSLRFPELSKTLLQSFMALLASARLICSSEEDALAQWEFHDLLFHCRSRVGRHPYPAGGTYPFRGKMPPLPAVKSQPALEKIPLFVPDLEKALQEDRPFTEILEARRSNKTKSASLNARQLGEFLFRAARIKSHFFDKEHEMTRRPYPGGGAIYELEIYPLVHDCEGLAPALYRYDPQNHLLELLKTPDAKSAQLLEDAARATKKKECPRILLLLSARFQRMTWKYQSIAYATMLKDAGALIQTFYLVATALRLHPSAVGVGNADLFAEIAELNYYEETTIAEFILS